MAQHNQAQPNQEILTLFAKLSEGDFTYRAQGDDDITRQANHLAAQLETRMLEQLDDMVGMTMNAFETTITMGRLEQDIGNLDDRAMAMASASEEMSANVTHVAERIEQVNSSIMDANQQSRDASMAVSNAVGAMNNIDQRVEQAGERVSALTVASREIDGILTVIKKISDQTNLLALNATIEAARAGEVGKGFAVVAYEVKELSQQTKQATEDIVEKIHRIQQDVSGIAAATQGISEAVDQGNQEMATVKGRMGEMSEALHVIVGEVDQITQATQDQSDASREVATSVAETAAMVSNARQVVDQTLKDTDAMESKLIAEIQEFSEMKLKGAILRLAKSDHILWKKRLINMILDRGDIELSTVASHHDCRLGKWYDTLGKQAYGSRAAFRELEVPHEKVHSLGRRAVERYNHGNKTAAISDVEAIAPLSEEVVALLDRLITESS
ncbi:MAG: methyl-accepting chemotaxis protein [Mariprofundaceae bacterium]|nr:methyl-accepting chemotaxis protein [Mariprofundaceae bacterium]